MKMPLGFDRFFWTVLKNTLKCFLIVLKSENLPKHCKNVFIIHIFSSDVTGDMNANFTPFILFFWIYEQKLSKHIEFLFLPISLQKDILCFLSWSCISIKYLSFLVDYLIAVDINQCSISYIIYNLYF